MKKILAIVFSILLLVLAGVMILQNKQQEDRRAEHMAQLVSEAKPYQKEIDAIRSELAKRENEIKVAPPVSSGIIGFLPTSAEDVSTVKELTAGYDFTPLMILDCAMDEEALQDIARMAINENFDLILAGMTFDQKVLKKADSLRAVLPEYGYEKEVSFFLRYPSDTKENREMLRQHGYQKLVVYSTTLDSGVNEQGVTYVSYGFAPSSDTDFNLITQTVAAHSYTVMIFDFADINSNKNGEAYVNRFLEIADNLVSNGEMQYTDIAAAFQAVAEADSTYKTRREEFEQYKLEQQKHIEELEKIISEIYSHWNEYEG